MALLAIFFCYGGCTELCKPQGVYAVAERSAVFGAAIVGVPNESGQSRARSVSADRRLPLPLALDSSTF